MPKISESYRCVVCSKMYHPAKTRADFKGLCSMGCQHALAKEQGFGTTNGPRTEWEAIRRVLIARRTTLPGTEPLGTGESSVDENLIEYRAVENPAKHLTMMRRPDDWPVWPFLPLKRYAQRGGTLQCGYLIADATVRYVVFEGVIGMAKPETDPRLTYDSHEAMITAGWMVD